VRARTKVSEVPVAIQRNFFAVRYSLQDIELEFAWGGPGSECAQSTFFRQFEGLLASEHNLLERLVLLHDFLHFRLDFVEVSRRKMMIHFQIVVETVLDWRPRSELRLRPDPQDGRR
jgi:hypothetical protein